MHIIKLNATDSTNSYLRQLSSQAPLSDYTIVTAEHQFNGRGQMGTQWESQEGKNLMVSVFKDISFLKFKHHHFISMVTSLALVNALQQFYIPKLFIKWPNDILSENKKICGILIENIVKQNSLKATIIGIGLNVNQMEFSDLPKASSMQAISGVNYNLEEVLQSVISNLKKYFAILKKQNFHQLKLDYEEHMFRKDKPSTFQDMEGNLFSGFIKGVSETGNLQVILEDNVTVDFGLKEITLLY